ncbi:class I SAM-dependent methyltransferase [Paraliomyxa miuraensis]|uniref:class I SAM-dependent methyltransferase n=1 Tax=Paraliomyxa miuraensis TaxID=376150 RepID=UPI002251D776|nr:SAM-dependent methyltransferase [Paraliomyxa miuraensis]MCX4242929.1 SAM-dependent methyltransferase [Paraliomyxa miuraensis]
MRLPALLSLVLLLGCRPPPTDPTELTDHAPASESASPSGVDGPADAPAAPLSREQLQAIVEAPDREDDDRRTDVRRKPVELLEFIGIAPGMKVADLGAGFGYTTELLARAVGPTGVVYGQNPAFVLERFAQEGWTKRLEKPVMANVIRLDREFVDPFPEDLQGLDAVINVMFYHDFEWMEVDRAAHDAAVFRALRPGGLYVIVDHSAADGAGASGSQTLHRIEESLVRSELQAAGFRLVREAEFLRNPQDTRDWNALPWRSGEDQLSDRFVLAFERP